MKLRFGTLTVVGLAALLGAGGGIGPAAYAQAPAASAADPAVDAAQSLVGRATFLRGEYAGGELEFDALGHVKGQPKVVDWTLAGVDVQKVTRRSGDAASGGELELDGVRVAIRYNPDQHVFERHPQKDEKLKILLAVNAEARGLQGALATVFSVGIDPALQRAMPPYWRHYFSPNAPWPNDEITGLTVIPANAPASGGLEVPVLEKKSEPEFTNEARQDHVKGTVQLKMTIGPDGVPHRVAIRQPLGYGLDERVVETASRFKFKPGTKDGKPVAVEMLLNQQFDVYPPPVR